MQKCLTGATGALFRCGAAELMTVPGRCCALLAVSALLLHLQPFIPAFIFVGKPRAGRAGNKKMKVVQGISALLPALLPPALLPAPPHPGMPRDAGAGGDTAPRLWLASGGDTSPTPAESCGRHLGTTGSRGTGGFWCLLSGSRGSGISFSVGKAVVGRGHKQQPGVGTAQSRLQA